MTWTPNHPGGVIQCDQPGCTRTHRNYCTPEERDGWRAAQEVRTGPFVRDYCPEHARKANQP